MQEFLKRSNFLFREIQFEAMQRNAPQQPKNCI